MATESVVETPNEKFGPRAFAGYDSSVYLAWIQSIGDLMLNAAQDDLPGRATSNLGGLILALSCSASELDERDRARRRAEAEA